MDLLQELWQSPHVKLHFMDSSVLDLFIQIATCISFHQDMFVVCVGLPIREVWWYEIYRTVQWAAREHEPDKVYFINVSRGFSCFILMSVDLLMLGHSRDVGV